MTTHTATSFRYVVDRRRDSLSAAKAKPPFGPSSIEILRSCGLRSCFGATSGLERRMGFSARVGTAFHRTLQHFASHPPRLRSPEHTSQVVRAHFHKEMAIQIAEVAKHPRESGLPRDAERIRRAEEAAVAEVIRLANLPLKVPHAASHARMPSASAPAALFAPQTSLEELREGDHAEISVRSVDGAFLGRIDRVEPRPEGFRIVEYKSALRKDLPERYARQVQHYAHMFHDTYGEWPVSGQVYYPLIGQRFDVPVGPAQCQRVADEAVRLVKRLEEQSCEDLAQPGDVCKVCEYRPWCRPFWKHQGSADSLSKALDRAAIGLEGAIRTIQVEKHYWSLEIAWGASSVTLIAPQERFPHFKEAAQGRNVRVLDAKLKGLRNMPRAEVSPFTEVWLVA